MKFNIADFSSAEIKRLDECMSNENIYAAAIEFLEQKGRKSHPKGSFDNANRFFLAETYECCIGLRAPSRAFPFSMLVHGRTAQHIAHHFRIPNDEIKVKQYARLIEKHPILKISYQIGKSILAAHEANKTLKSINASSLRKSKSQKLNSDISIRSL